ncbi:hypothetical protein [Symbiopectobacterium purcellii]|uniref:hypothetical protein n=1 Tax=Symbiopectobacterium purcellii TaxID=2871826 RepID=UPI003F8792EA
MKFYNAYINQYLKLFNKAGAALSECFVVGGPVGDFKLLLCHGELLSGAMIVL